MTQEPTALDTKHDDLSEHQKLFVRLLIAEVQALKEEIEVLTRKLNAACAIIYARDAQGGYP